MNIQLSFKKIYYTEYVFGILANKWRIFHRPLDVNEETTVWVVKV